MNMESVYSQDRTIGLDNCYCKKDSLVRSQRMLHQKATDVRKLSTLKNLIVVRKSGIRNSESITSALKHDPGAAGTKAALG